MPGAMPVPGRRQPSETENLTVIKTLADALDQRGYTSLTQVQEAVTEPSLAQADLLVSAQTGSGKTVGFGLAIAPGLLGEDGRFGPAANPLALVIAPTRELALQVKRELSWLYQQTGAVVTSCVGGMDMRDERRALGRGTHIVVATPGRLRDHIERGSMQMEDLRAVVLDEADEMLDLGFREDLEFILGQAPDDRRTLLFSATVPRAIATLAQQYQKDAVRVTTGAEASQHTDIEYLAMPVSPRDIENAVINVLRFHEAQNALVFCNTRAVVNRLTTRFSNRGFSVVALSGELTQNERTHALQAMRDGRARVCVATDVAARGIDLPNLDLVVHADLPGSAETMLHRSGRTGRAGRKGTSALIVPVNQRKKAERLLQFAKVRAEWKSPPSVEDVLAEDEKRLLADPSWEQEITETEQGFVDKLTERYTPDQIAAAFLRLHQSRQSAPEELAVADTPRAANKFGPSVWFSVAAGRDQRAEPRWLLPAICRAGDITRDDIGAIRVQEQETFFEVLAASADGFEAALGPARVLKDGQFVTRLDAMPELEGFQRVPPKRPHRGKRREDTSPAAASVAPAEQAAKKAPAPDRVVKRENAPKHDRDTSPGRQSHKGRRDRSKAPDPVETQPRAEADKPRRASPTTAGKPTARKQSAGTSTAGKSGTNEQKPARKQNHRAKLAAHPDAADPSKSLRRARGEGAKSKPANTKNRPAKGPARGPKGAHAASGDASTRSPRRGSGGDAPPKRRKT